MEWGDSGVLCAGAVGSSSIEIELLRTTGTPPLIGLKQTLTRAHEHWRGGPPYSQHEPASRCWPKRALSAARTSPYAGGFGWAGMCVALLSVEAVGAPISLRGWGVSRPPVKKTCGCRAEREPTGATRDGPRWSGGLETEGGHVCGDERSRRWRENAQSNSQQVATATSARKRTKAATLAPTIRIGKWMSFVLRLGAKM